MGRDVGAEYSIKNVEEKRWRRGPMEVNDGWRDAGIK